MAPNADGSALPPEDQQPPRKKVRKGTSSCWECKHRKVRCTVSENDTSCRECLTRGSACHSQDLPEPENPRESERPTLNERLGRVETLLERVINRLDGFVDAGQAAPPNRALNKVSISPSPDTPAENENAPVLSLFDNEVLGFRRSCGATLTHNKLDEPSIDNNRQKLRSELLALLPSQKVLDELAQVNSCWWLCRKQCFQDNERFLSSIPVSELSGSSLDSIAKVLLWVSICLQQSSSNSIDAEFLGLDRSPTQFIEKCLDLTSRFICSDESVVNTVEGLECLVLQGILYNNDGRLRSSWSSYRRALNISQLIGLHHLSSVEEANASLSRSVIIFHHIVHADRYLSLILGMYHGIGDGVLDRQKVGPIESPMAFLCRIAGSIIERNHRFTSATPDMLRITKMIDSDLHSIDRPLEISDISIPTSGKTEERANMYSRLMEALWHYQLLAWLHLPLFLEPLSQKRFSYHQLSCLEASRNMIKCYEALRKLTAESFCCKSLDFQAFTAAVTLLLNILRADNSISVQSEDWSSVESVIKILSRLAESEPSGKVATRGLNVLQTLRDVAKGNKSRTSERIKLDIPYFGTIKLDTVVSRKSNQQPRSTTIPVISEYHRSNEPPPLVSNFGIGPDLQAPSTSISSWQENQLEFEAMADCWTFDSDLTMIPPFPDDFENGWGLGL